MIDGDENADLDAQASAVTDLDSKILSAGGGRFDIHSSMMSEECSRCCIPPHGSWLTCAMRDESMMSGLRTRRLVLRRQEARDAAVFHQLWTERDPRVPAHRRLDAYGHPTVDEIAAHIAGERAVEGPG